MADRFRDNEIWKRAWYRKLGPVRRDAYNYIHDFCDCVGVWIPDFEAAEFYIGEKIDWEDLLAACNNNIEVLPNGKWWIVDFCDFQYGELTEKCPPHRKYITLLKRYGLYDRVMKGYQKGISTLQEEEEEEDISSPVLSCITSPKADFSDIDKHIEKWNSYDHLPHYRFLTFNMKPEDTAAARRMKSVYSSEEVEKAIENYAEISRGLDYTPFPVYATFAGFLSGGVEKYADDAKPFDRCRKKRTEAESGEDVLRRIRGGKDGL